MRRVCDFLENQRFCSCCKQVCPGSVFGKAVSKKGWISSSVPVLSGSRQQGIFSSQPQEVKVKVNKLRTLQIPRESEYAGLCVREGLFPILSNRFS